jgi:hypothetical protein
VKDWDKILVHVIMSLSFGISLLGCSRYIIFDMANYIFASEIKFVPTLYLSTSLSYPLCEDLHLSTRETKLPSLQSIPNSILHQRRSCRPSYFFLSSASLPIVVRHQENFVATTFIVLAFACNLIWNGCKHPPCS